jgi:hypothetical protein
MGRALTALAVGLALAATAAAQTITGSSRAETLRGTARADVIYGKQGKDTLFGGRGNDVLVPGAGADAVHCGAGRDLVRADREDVVARDCEAVVRAGAYAGVSSQNERVTFRVLSGASRLAAFRINSVNQSCQPPDRLSIFGALDFRSASFTVADDGAFVATYVGPGTVSGRAARFDIWTKGRFTRDASAGTARFDMTFSDDGTDYTCSSGVVAWDAAPER